ncbi:MAG: radical SAM protein [Bacteroidales bacterium]|nr:radical SAM protein [Bacteroidales bacterium]
MWYSRIKHIKRHIYEFLPYITFKKIFNLIFNIIEKHLRISSLKSYPVVLKIDPSPFCQLSCLHCNHNDSEYNKQFKFEENLSKDSLIKIIEPLKKSLIWISLSHRGEPFMNPQLLDLIEYIHKNNIAVSLPTNFSIKLNDNKIERIAKSGLDKLFISLDGASQKTYEKYRIGGDFELVLSNVKKLSNYKTEHNLSRPKIIWKFIIFDYNTHETNFVKKNYKLLGFDSYEFHYNNNGNITKEYRNKCVNNMIENKKNCFWLWHAMVIQSDGQVNPCCNGKNYNIGNAFESNLINIWKNNVYKNLRNGFKKDYFPNNLHEFCKGCYQMH